MSKTIINLNYFLSSIDRVNAINDEAPKLAKWFYINSKRKITYFRKSSFNTHLEVWNRGTNRWEHAAEISEDRLHLLPAYPTTVTPQQKEVIDQSYDEKDDPSIEDVLALGNEELAIQNAKAFNTTSNVEAEVQVLDVQLKQQTNESVNPVNNIVGGTLTTNSFKPELPKTNEEGTYINLSVEDVQWIHTQRNIEETSPLSQINELKEIFKKFLPKGFILEFTPEEYNYSVVYDYDKQKWSDLSHTSLYIAGTVYTNSRTCVDNVVSYLNDKKLTPTNLN